MSSSSILNLSKNIKALTLDVFDTFLLRNTKPEIYRFYEISRLHQKLLKDKGYEFSLDEIFYCRQLCIEIAYKTAKLNNYEKDAKIKDIYKLMLNALNIKNEGIIEDMLKTELEYEVKNLKLNKKLICVVEELRRNKKLKIFFISDMYLSKVDILFLINNFAKEFKFDNLYVSSEYSITKLSGSLYDLLLKKENLNVEEILHIGDNYSSDFVSAKKKGLKTIYMPRSKLFKLIYRLREKLFRISMLGCVIQR
jgi:HAD superfamily hydrolase (TIGR01549 family)